jgi:hypothetical protein
MKLRNHPLMSCVGMRNWPPAWLWRDGSEDTRPAGEVGLLRHVILSDIDPPKRCFLVMEHMGAEYIGYLSFENSAFCREIYRVLRDHCGNPINEIGDVDTSLCAKYGPIDRRQMRCEGMRRLKISLALFARACNLPISYDFGMR